VKNDKAEKSENRQTYNGKYRAENLAAIKSRLSKRSNQAGAEQDSAGAKKQEIRPRKIPRYGKLYEKRIGQEAREENSKPRLRELTARTLAEFDLTGSIF